MNLKSLVCSALQCYSQSEYFILSRGLFSEPEVCSYHPGQSGCEEFAAPLPRYPFQIQSGVAAVTHLVALKDCNQ